MSTLIRTARKSDAKRLSEIYSYYVEQTAYSFESKAPDEIEFAERLLGILPFHPYLVFEQDGKILGYAYAHKAFSRAAYDWCAEVSVYVDKDFRSKGVGGALYRAIIQILGKMGYRLLYAIIESGNTSSISFHERAGFVRFALFENTGYKLGAWRSLVWMKMSLNAALDEPEPIKPFIELDKEYIEQVYEISVMPKMN